MTDNTTFGMDSFQGTSVLYDRHAMFKGSLDVRVKKMMKLGKNNIKYIASGPDLVDGCKGLLGRLSTLDDEARSQAMQAAKKRSEMHSPSNEALNRQMSDVEKQMRMKSAGVGRVPSNKHEQLLMFRDNLGGFYTKNKIEVVTDSDIKVGAELGLSDS